MQLCSVYPPVQGGMKVVHAYNMHACTTFIILPVLLVHVTHNTVSLAVRITFVLYGSSHARLIKI